MGESLPISYELCLKTALMAGKILMRSGSETGRVEDTMTRIIQKTIDTQKFEVYVLLNVVFVQVGDYKTSFLQVASRANNLGDINTVNQISRDYTAGKITLEETWQSLERLQNETYPNLDPLKLFSAAMLSGFVVFLFGGRYADFFPALFSGLTAYITYHLSARVLNVPFSSEYIASFVGGCVGYVLCKYTGANLDMVTIGTVMSLVPGIAITNAIRDIMHRHYITGMIRFLECICIGAALGGGTATVFYLFAR